MTRVQVHLMEEDDRWLEEQASRRRTSKSALVREAVRLLQEQDRSDMEHMLKLIGLAGSDPEGPTDGAVNHDKYIYDDEYERWHRPS